MFTSWKVEKLRIMDVIKDFITDMKLVVIMPKSSIMEFKLAERKDFLWIIIAMLAMIASTIVVVVATIIM